MSVRCRSNKCLLESARNVTQDSMKWALSEVMRATASVTASSSLSQAMIVEFVACDVRFIGQGAHEMSFLKALLKIQGVENELYNE